MVSRSSRRNSEHERAERRRADRERLRKAAEELLSSEGWTALISPGAPSATTSIGAPSPRAMRSLARASQSSCNSHIPRHTPTRTRSPSSVKPQAQRTPSFGPFGLTLRKIASRNSATSLTP
jgi:hypothetical protein